MFNLYPNPSTGVINITAVDNRDIESIQVYDLNGKLVFLDEKTYTQHHQLDLSALEPGVYFIELYSKAEKGIAKLVLK